MLAAGLPAPISAKPLRRRVPPARKINRHHMVLLMNINEGTTFTSLLPPSPCFARVLRGLLAALAPLSLLIRLPFLEVDLSKSKVDDTLKIFVAGKKDGQETCQLAVC